MRKILAMALFFSAAVSCRAAKPHLSIDAGECGEDTPTKPSVAKTPVFTNDLSKTRAYGELQYRRLGGASGEAGYHVIYRLFISAKDGAFIKVKEVSSDIEQAEIAGIDLVGLSANGNRCAADFWWAEGDGEEHRPVVVDLVSKVAIDLPLKDKIQKRIHGCDQSEDFVGVTNDGEAVFAIPPSIYDDSPGCGDKGIWHFNLKTGNVYRVAKISGDKWQ